MLKHGGINLKHVATARASAKHIEAETKQMKTGMTSLLKLLVLTAAIACASASSLSKRAEQGVGSGYTLVTQHDYQGQLLLTYHDGNVENCQNACNQRADCALVRTKGQDCGLVKATEGVSFTGDEAANVYIKKSPPSKYVKLKNVDATNGLGLVIRRFDGNPDFCEFLCNQDSNCQMVSYNTDNKNIGCWLMRGPEGGTQATVFERNNERFFALLVPNGQPATEKHYIKQANAAADDAVSFMGEAVLEGPTEEDVRKECQRQCDFLNECTAFYHERATKTCRFFKKGFSAVGAQPGDLRDLYVHKNQPSLTFLDIPSLEVGPEGNLGTITASLKDCDKQCTNLPGCVGYSFTGQEPSLECTFKKAMNTRKRLEGSNFRIALASSANVKSFLKYTGFDLAEADAALSTIDPPETDYELAKQRCEHECIRVTECKGFVLQSGPFKCRFYKEGFVLSASQQPQRDLFIHKNRPGMEYIQIQNLGISGQADIGKIANPEVHCNEYCDNLPGCIGYSMMNDKNVKECALKKSFEGRTSDPSVSFWMVISAPAKSD